MRGILFVATKSKYSVVCIQNIRTVYSNLPFEIIVVRLDTESVRKSVKKYITSVPTLLIVDREGDTRLLYGLDQIFPFIKSFLSKNISPEVRSTRKNTIQNSSESLKRKKKKRVIIDNDNFPSQRSIEEININDSNVLSDTNDIQEIEIEYQPQSIDSEEEEDDDSSDPRKRSTKALQGFLINNGTKESKNSMSSLKEQAAKMQEERFDTLGYKDAL